MFSLIFSKIIFSLERKFVFFKNLHLRTSLMIQWLRFHASTAGAVGSIPGWGTKIHVMVKLKKKKQLAFEYILNSLIWIENNFTLEYLAYIQLNYTPVLELNSCMPINIFMVIFCLFDWECHTFKVVASSNAIRFLPNFELLLNI